MHPGCGEENVVSLLRICKQVIDPRHGSSTQLAKGRVLLLEVQFPVTPLHVEDFIAHVDDKSLAAGPLSAVKMKIVLSEMP